VAPSSIGEQELALLRYVSDRGGATVAEAVEGFGAPRGLARSTVLTVMDRLRRKGHLTRKLVGGIYRYRARASSADLLLGVVRRFVETNLDGSVSPLVAYLSETPALTEAKVRELEDLVARLQSGRAAKEPR
jgi:predicted transcriptional regulator